MRAAIVVPALALALACPFASATTAAAGDGHGDGLKVMGLTVDQRLVSFSEDAP